MFGKTSATVFHVFTHKQTTVSLSQRQNITKRFFLFGSSVSPLDFCTHLIVALYWVLLARATFTNASNK